MEFNKYEKWMTLNDVIQYSNLSASTIRRAIKRGQLKCTKATGKYLFKLEQVDKFLEW
jgi:excisionase family DNA binding protein